MKRAHVAHVVIMFVKQGRGAGDARAGNKQGATETFLMPTRLTLICDGATAATRIAAFPLDEPLEDRALSRAAVLGHALRRADRALTSPALRARQTAAALSLDPAVNSSLRDCDYGRWAGRRLADVQEEEPDSIAAWISDADAAPHGGELLIDLFRRVFAWMNERIGEDGHTIGVTHMGVIRAPIRAVILHVLEAPARSFWRIDIEPLSVTNLCSDGIRWTLRTSGNTMGKRR